MITMKGNLITLEPLDIHKHAEGYFNVCQDENIHKYTGNTVPQRIDETIDLLKKYETFFYNWMIISNKSMSVIGMIRLGKPEAENGVLIAGESQFLMSQYWRKGHMKEAKKLFYQYVFDQLTVDVLYADVWDGNTNSMKSLEYYGYRLVETRKEIFPKSGKYTTKFIYTLRKDDYLQNMKNKELLKLSPGELTDMGICPTCFNRENGGALYGDLTDKMLYEDEEIECFFVGNPRADGHMCISTIAHYHDMSEAPDHINEKIVRFAKQFMRILCDVYGCERVYLCTMCDGPNNHYHVQLIPRYPYEKRGSRNFVKDRKPYQFDKLRFDTVRKRIAQYAKETNSLAE